MHYFVAPLIPDSKSTFFFANHACPHQVYRGGKRVDEYLVRDQQMMKDRMWLWAPDREGMQLQ